MYYTWVVKIKLHCSASVNMNGILPSGRHPQTDTPLYADSYYPRADTLPEQITPPGRHPSPADTIGKVFV